MLLAGLDIETTGLAMPPAHRMLEICLALYDVDSQRKLGQLVRRFNPGRPVDPDAQAVHGISFDDVAHLPMLEHDAQAISLIQRILTKADFVVAHNGASFDVPFVQAEFACIGQPLPRIRLVDTMLEARWATALGKLPNLGELCFATRVPYDPESAHAADYDVDVMVQAFFRGLEWGFFKIPEEVTLKEAA